MRSSMFHSMSVSPGYIHYKYIQHLNFFQDFMHMGSSINTSDLTIVIQKVYGTFQKCSPGLNPRSAIYAKTLASNEENASAAKDMV